MKIGDHVIRTGKYDKRNTEHHIRTQKELEYHLDLQAQGYEYMVIGEEREKKQEEEGKKEEKKEEFDFDLPVEQGGLRIHKARPADCESCSA